MKLKITYLTIMTVEREFSTVLITVPDRESAKKIARNVIEKKLAACVNIYPVESMYWWKNQIEEATEFILLIKIRSQDFNRLKDFILKSHPYELPCIVRYEIVEGHKPYLDWIKESTAEHREG